MSTDSRPRHRPGTGPLYTSRIPLFRSESLSLTLTPGLEPTQTADDAELTGFESEADIGLEEANMRNMDKWTQTKYDLTADTMLFLPMHRLCNRKTFLQRFIPPCIKCLMAGVAVVSTGMVVFATGVHFNLIPPYGLLGFCERFAPQLMLNSSCHCESKVENSSGSYFVELVKSVIPGFLKRF